MAQTIELYIQNKQKENNNNNDDKRLRGTWGRVVAWRVNTGEENTQMLVVVVVRGGRT